MKPHDLISQRTLIKLAGLGLTAAATGAWRNRFWSESVSAAPACVLTPEQTQGPYYIAREKVRSNITENWPGTPLRLQLTVVDATSPRRAPEAA